ncbi:MAG: hypothetical protein KDJ33_01705 [Gammaproteobacteria bacterium]|nr:hypothetical protein [Gammaproteobacteria bacterium]
MSVLRALTVAVGTTLLIATISSASAGNVFFMKDSPLANMGEGDLEAFRSAARRALDDAGDGEAVRWENATSGAGGLLTPLSTSERDGSVCRRLRIQNAVGGQSANSEFDFCRQADGTWKVPPSDASRN